MPQTPTSPRDAVCAIKGQTASAASADVLLRSRHLAQEWSRRIEVHRFAQTDAIQVLHRREDQPPEERRNRTSAKISPSRFKTRA